MFGNSGSYEIQMSKEHKGALYYTFTPKLLCNINSSFINTDDDLMMLLSQAHRLQDMGTAEDQEAAQKKLEPILGSWSAEQVLLTSTVKVEESILEGGYALPITRNAIDRFTGGTVRGALYTGEPWVGGHTKLVLRWPCRLEKALSDAICGLLLWVVSDLQNGLLAVGGETAAGRGIFEKDGAVELDGETLNDSKSYYKAALEWCQCAAQLRIGGIK